MCTYVSACRTPAPAAGDGVLPLSTLSLLLLLLLLLLQTCTVVLAPEGVAASAVDGVLPLSTLLLLLLLLLQTCTVVLAPEGVELHWADDSKSLRSSLQLRSEVRNMHILSAAVPLSSSLSSCTGLAVGSLSSSCPHGSSLHTSSCCYCCMPHADVPCRALMLSSYHAT
jgi:hypothetical protein